MFHTARAKRRSRRPRSRWWGVLKVLLLIIVPCVLWAAVNLHSLDDYMRALSMHNKVVNDVEKLDAEIAQLKTDIEELDTRGLPDERIVRERMKLVRPGEKLVFIEWKDDLADQ